MGIKQAIQKHRKTFAAGIAITVTTMLYMPAAWSDSSQGTVRLGVPAWPGVEIKSAVVEAIIEPLGYEVETKKASAPIVYRGLADGEIDINMSAWSPGQRPAFGPYVDKGKVLELAENLRGATAGFAVPKYIYDAGLKSDEQITEYADKFDKEVYCIDTGSGANEVVSTGIENDTYGMGDWKIVASSTAGMLAQVKKSVRNEKWIMFCGWRPHWMNVIYDMKYLKDTEDLWGPNGGQSRVYTLATDGFPKANPDMARFFKQFQVDASVQSQWIYQYAYKEREPETVAKEWISANMEAVKPWLDGVETADGGNAVEALRKAYGDM